MAAIYGIIYYGNKKQLSALEECISGTWPDLEREVKGQDNQVRFTDTSWVPCQGYQQ